MTRTSQVDAVVAGHICLDIIPTFDGRAGSSNALLVPGRLVNVGPAQISTGGAVSNTGLALNRLGIPTRLMGKIGDDLFGRAILEVIRRRDPGLASGMVIAPEATSSYTLVISPPGVDRSFLHCPGANDTFGADDIDTKQIAGARVFHLGYPPLMHRMYADGGVELATIFRRVKNAGLTSSLDMADVEIDSAVGEADWQGLLNRVLPYVDLFLPSFEEVFLMLDPSRYQKLAAKSGSDDILAQVDAGLLREMTDELLRLGPAVVGLKLGAQGIYLRTVDNEQRLAAMGELSLPATWSGRELLAPTFRVRVTGTTGAGDCAIAGFLAAVLKGMPVEAALASAVAAGASNVESADAISGVPTWTALQARIQAGWERAPVDLSLPLWRYHEDHGLWTGPLDPLHG